MDELALLEGALEFTDHDERMVWLDAQFGDSFALRQRIDAFLTNHDLTGKFLASPSKKLCARPSPPKELLHAHERTLDLDGQTQAEFEIADWSCRRSFVESEIIEEIALDPTSELRRCVA